LHHFTAFFASSEVFRIVILVEVCKEISFDVLEFEIGFMEFVVAVVAEPKQTVFESFAYANAFDDQSDGTCRSSWAMGYTRGE
jgi:hypothetical protein